MNSNVTIPVGFRFHPTDDELLGHYLLGKVTKTHRDEIIRELDLYKREPWDLAGVSNIIGDPDDWYFFSQKDRKYPTGNRANRATAAGFWKATGRDKRLRTPQGLIGMRKTLVFYLGRAPNGEKTDWIMHEFRLEDGLDPNYHAEAERWVICRVFVKPSKSSKKKSPGTPDDQQFALQSSPEKFSSDGGDGGDDGGDADPPRPFDNFGSTSSRHEIQPPPAFDNFGSTSRHDIPSGPFDNFGSTSRYETQPPSSAFDSFGATSRHEISMHDYNVPTYNPPMNYYGQPYGTQQFDNMASTSMSSGASFPFPSFQLEPSAPYNFPDDWNMARDTTSDHGTSTHDMGRLWDN